MSFLLLTDDKPNVGLFLPELGRLHIQGTRFYTETGELWQWRGYSWFLGFLRFCRGEDVTPDLRWMRAMGINIPRLFGPLPWVETPDYRVENFQWDKLPAFLELLQKHGLRSNWSLFHYKAPGLKAFAQRFYDVAQHYWTVSAVEGVNEPQNGNEKPDPRDILTGVNRHGIPTAYGYYPTDKNPAIPPILDFGTVHLPRDDNWHRKARDAQWLMNETDKIWISDEPAKIAEPGFQGAGVKNDPATTPAEASWHFGVCHLWTPGGTIHTQHGRNGLVPAPGTLTHTAVEAVRDNVWLKLDPNVQLGGYTGSHFSTSPVDHIPMVWSYSSMHGNRAWSVRCEFSAPQAVNGWQVKERWGASGSFVRLER